MGNVVGPKRMPIAPFPPIGRVENEAKGYIVYIQQIAFLLSLLAQCVCQLIEGGGWGFGCRVGNEMLSGCVDKNILLQTSNTSLEPGITVYI